MAYFVAVIGGANIDLHARPDQPLRSHDSNPGTVHTSAGGVARNVAENLARLGVDARLVSAVGDDHYGEMLLRLSREAGVNVEHVQRIDGAATSTYLSVLDDTGDVHVAIAAMNIIDQLDVTRLKPLQSMLRQSSLIVLDANLCDDALAWLTQTFADKPIYADTVSTRKASRLKPYLSAIDTLKTSRIEAEALTGLKAQTPVQRRELANQLHAQGVEQVFVTLGAEGVFYSADGQQVDQKPAHGDRIVRSTAGAGDAFLAGLAYGRLEEFSLDNSARFALAAADITLSHSATSNPALSLAAINRALEIPHDV